MKEMNENTTVDFCLSIAGDIFDKNQPYLTSSDISIKEIVRMCRRPMERGGGCPVGVFLPCPFRYQIFLDHHKGEPPVDCSNVTVDDWIEFFNLIND